MDLRTRPAGAGIAHFPEIVFFGTVQNALLGHKPAPNGFGLLIRGQTVLLVAPKNRYVEAVFVNFVDVRQQLPRPRQRLLLEVVAKTPVAQHFKQRVVVGIVPHFL